MNKIGIKSSTRKTLTQHGCIINDEYETQNVELYKYEIFFR